MAAQGHEISLRKLKNISRVSVSFKLFYDEFNAAQRRFDFVECYVVKLLSCVSGKFSTFLDYS